MSVILSAAKRSRRTRHLPAVLRNNDAGGSLIIRER
jgi:hypothetical protein